MIETLSLTSLSIWMRIGLLIDSIQNIYHDQFREYPIAVPLATFMVMAFFVLIICRLRISSPKEITAEIRREIKNKVDDVKDFVGVGTRPRFRKRDKIYFYGRKMLRKVKANIPMKSVQSRQLARKIARRILGRSEKDDPQLKVIEPPMEYLQEDLLPLESSIPTEFLIMLKNIRVFGHFDMPLFLELCKSLETIHLRKGQSLFQIGESDEHIFIVQSGCLRVSITEDGASHELKIVTAGESIISLLSFCDVLTGHPQPYKTVSAKALEDSIIMMFPVKAFEEIFQKHPDMYVRVVQIIMVRLMRVTILALHTYLGLAAELMSRVPRRASCGNVLFSPIKMKKDSGGSIPESDLCMLDEDTIDRGVTITEPVEKDRKLGKKIVLMDPKDDGEKMRLLATEQIKTLLHLDSSEMLDGEVELRDVSAGEFLLKQDSIQDTALFYILTGSVMVFQVPSDGAAEIQLYIAHPGDLVGGLAVLSGDPSFFNVKAKCQSRVAAISKDAIYKIIKQNPRVVLHVANTVIIRMSPFVRQIDFALDWEHLEAGRALYKQGQSSDSTYIVLSGRLRSVITHQNGRKEVIGEYGKGDLVGIVELLTQTERSTTVMAIRDSELAKLPEGLFNVIKLKHPVVMTRLIKLLGQRILGTWKASSKEPLGLNIDQRPTQSNLSTVAIVPISEEVPLSQFTLELYHSLLAIGPATRLTSDYVIKSLGTSIWESANEYQLISWLGHIEDQNRVTLYQCDPTLTVWSQRCIRQADVILTVGLASKEPCVGKIEKHVEAMAIRTQKILVLLHSEGGPRPSGTVKWLNMRSWCHSHHHVLAPKRVFMKKAQNKIIEYYTEKVFTQEPNVFSDFSRLARVLTGTSIGLVLGGGGARGAAHIGMMKALQEVGIPIDMVGGVSIGALFGALYCMDKDLTTVTRKAREWSVKMTSKWRMIIDLTYPMVSMFTGAGFNKIISETLGDISIEDLWLPYFTLTTDITDSCARIHTHGCTWRYVRASMSLSGYMPPICDPHDGHLLLDGGYVNNLPGPVWRYVRGSMSLAMLLPPMPDPIDGHLLVDGCYVNNVPADVMRNRFSVGTILAIDVGSQFESQFTNYGDHLSGWELLLRGTRPFKYFFRSELKVPNLYDIQTRLSYVSCTRQLEELKTSGYCEYIRPPIDKFQTLSFNCFDEIKDVGYHHGKSYFSGMMKSGRSVEHIYKLKTEALEGDLSPKSLNLHSCPANFIDLAQIVCSVKNPKGVQAGYDSTSSQEEEVQSGYASEPNTGVFQDDSDYLGKARRRRTGSLSDNELIELDPYDDTDSHEDELVENEMAEEVAEIEL